MPSTMKIFMLTSLCVVLFLASNLDARTMYKKRSVIRPHIPNPNETEECRIGGICGWEVYNVSTRARQYYVATSCQCNPSLSCIRIEDDITIPAYVYRCKMIKTRNRTRSTESPSS